jgi:hypothetical protein
MLELMRPAVGARPASNGDTSDEQLLLVVLIS